MQGGGGGGTRPPIGVQATRKMRVKNTIYCAPCSAVMNMRGHRWRRLRFMISKRNPIFLRLRVFALGVLAFSHEYYNFNGVMRTR